MVSFVVFIIIFVAIMALSTLIFGGWFIVMILRGIGQFLGLLPNPGQAQIGPRRRSGAVQIGPLSDLRSCPYELCKAANALDARFCRRCGRQLAAPAHVHVRRAAML